LNGVPVVAWDKVGLEVTRDGAACVENDGRAAKVGCEKVGRLKLVIRAPPKPPPPKPRATAISVETRHELPRATTAVIARTEVRFTEV
jgi:hypothetical protein